MNLKPEDFPAQVQLVYEVRQTLPPDAGPEELAPAPWPMVIETYHFATLAEALP